MAMSPSTAASVYPRVGGGTALFSHGLPPFGGLSPRGRGNLCRAIIDSVSGGSIPAWAGEPAITTTMKTQGAVYPRVGGGTVGLAEAQEREGGLSPRGRGNRDYIQDYAVGARSIPAWAGEPRGLAESLEHDAVYPRVGGGTQLR